MEENRMKKAYSWILILFMVFTVLFSGFACETVNAATNLKSVYTKFVKQEMKKGNLPETVYCNMYDFDKNGVKELVVADVGGVRAWIRVYTYVNGKIKFLADGNDIGYVKGKKYLVSYGSGGCSLYGYDVYKISGGKAKNICSYLYDEGVYKKNNKKISEKTYLNFEKTVKFGLGKTFTISK